MILPDLRRAIDDADRGPSPGDLDDAPVLNHWWIDERPGGILTAVGDLSGHPDIRDPTVRTSPVIGFDLAGGWLRTRSRWYRIQSPMPLPGVLDALTAFQERLATDRQAWERAESDPHMGFCNTPPPAVATFVLPTTFRPKSRTDDQGDELNGW